MPFMDMVHDMGGNSLKKVGENIDSYIMENWKLKKVKNTLDMDSKVLWEWVG
jgi:hypothetical protein